MEPNVVDTNGDGYNDKLVVPGEGVWTVDPQSGKITFTPEAGFTGDPTPIQYQIRDKYHNISNVSRVVIRYKKDGEISGFYWHDENANGIQDTGEPGVVGRTVYLTALDGTVIQSVKTDSNGYYTFSNVVQGKDYIVRFSLPSDYLATVQDQGGDRNKDSDANTQGIAKIDNFDGSQHIADMGIYCECDDVEVHPNKYKSSSASAFNLFGILLSIVTLGLLARRKDKEA